MAARSIERRSVSRAMNEGEIYSASMVFYGYSKSIYLFLYMVVRQQSAQKVSSSTRAATRDVQW